MNPDYVTAKLADSNWKPSRALIESARNEIVRLRKSLEGPTEAQSASLKLALRYLRDGKTTEGIDVLHCAFPNEWAEVCEEDAAQKNPDIMPDGFDVSQLSRFD